MATEQALKSVSLEAGGDHSSSQYKFVSQAPNGQFDLTGKGGRAVGVLQDAPAAAGRAGQVANGGKTKVRLGGTVATGADIASDANGLAVTAETGDIVLGSCAEGGANGEIGSMFFNPSNIVA